MHTDTQQSRTAISAEDTLNTIVERYPNALPVLQRFGLDTCCGGALPLHIAAQHHHLNAEAILQALRAVVEVEAP